MSQRRLLSCLVVALAAGSATLQLAAAQSTPVASQRVPGPNHHDDPARHPHLGVWVTPDGHIRHELLPDGRYDEQRGDRRHAYQGRYWIKGHRIVYRDDTGFAADGEFRDGRLLHGGYVFTRVAHTASGPTR